MTILLAALSFAQPDAPCAPVDFDAQAVLTCADGRRFEPDFYILTSDWQVLVLGYDR